MEKRRGPLRPVKESSGVTVEEIRKNHREVLWKSNRQHGQRRGALRGAWTSSRSRRSSTSSRGSPRAGVTPWGPRSATPCATGCRRTRLKIRIRSTEPRLPAEALVPSGGQASRQPPWARSRFPGDVGSRPPKPDFLSARVRSVESRSCVSIAREVSVAKRCSTTRASTDALTQNDCSTTRPHVSCRLQPATVPNLSSVRSPPAPLASCPGYPADPAGAF